MPELQPSQRLDRGLFRAGGGRSPPKAAQPINPHTRLVVLWVATRAIFAAGAVKGPWVTSDRRWSSGHPFPPRPPEFIAYPKLLNQPLPCFAFDGWR